MTEDFISRLTFGFTREGRIQKRGFQVVETIYGETLEACPETPYSQLFAPISDQAIQIADANQIAVIGGVSGSGKTELLLRDNGREFGNPNLDVGGIVQFLNLSEIPYFKGDFQAANIQNQVARALGDTSNQYFIFDESTLLARDSSKDRVEIVQRILGDGRKIILVGGGQRPGYEQCHLIQEALHENDIQVDDSQLILLRPTILTLHQAEELLVAKNYSHEQSQQLVLHFVQQNVPLTVRVLYQVMPNSSVLGDASMSTFDLILHDQNYVKKISYMIDHLKISR